MPRTPVPPDDYEKRMREFLDERDRWIWLRALGMKGTVVIAAIAGTIVIIRDWIGDIVHSLFDGGN